MALDTLDTQTLPPINRWDETGYFGKRAVALPNCNSSYFLVQGRDKFDLSPNGSPVFQERRLGKSLSNLRFRTNLSDRALVLHEDGNFDTATTT